MSVIFCVKLIFVILYAIGSSLVVLDNRSYFSKIIGIPIVLICASVIIFSGHIK